MIERLVIIGHVELSSEVLTRLGEAGIGCVFMPGRGQKRSTFMRSESHGDAVRRLGQYQFALTSDHTSFWARNIVRLRVAGQRRLLGHVLQERPDQRHTLWKACKEIDVARSTLRDPELSLESLRGQEGAAAAAFFRGYTSLFPKSLGFYERNRRPPRDPVNAVLSLGYALAHGDALRAITASGLDPAIGFLHQPAWGRDSLACDLTELARSRVELLTWHLFAHRELETTNFSNSPEGGVRLRKDARYNFFSRWEVHARLHRNWQKRAAQLIANYCSSYGKSLFPGGGDEH